VTAILVYDTVQTRRWSEFLATDPQVPGFDSRRYQTFWELVGVERGPLSLVSTTEEPLGRKSSGSGLENRDYGHRESAELNMRYPSMH
jgi:hypothetical protein